jgi:hypothetical protein
MAHAWEQEKDKPSGEEREQEEETKVWETATLTDENLLRRNTLVVVENSCVDAVLEVQSLDLLVVEFGFVYSGASLVGKTLRGRGLPVWLEAREVRGVCPRVSISSDCAWLQREDNERWSPVRVMRARRRRKQTWDPQLRPER